MYFNFLGCFVSPWSCKELIHVRLLLRRTMDERKVPRRRKGTKLLGDRLSAPL